MKIVILSGGTGSIQLQRGIYKLFNGVAEGLDIKVLVNAYDNGLSTGLVRRVCDGKILGPSDVRKNQTLLHEIYYGNTELLKVLNIRFSLPANEVEEYAETEINSLQSTIGQSKVNVMLDGLEAYFKSENSRLIDYDDFSLSNMIYAGLAALHGNSLRTAAAIMSDVLAIPDSVILNSDESLYLKALSESGQLIDDEGDIVTWSNPQDKIKSIFFTDCNGQEKLPVLCEEAKLALQEADLIISSSGTQWSSLIPTYISIGFREAYETSNAMKFLVMNKTQDKDMLGVSASDICSTVSQFMSLCETNVIVDTTGDNLLASVQNAYETGIIKNAIYDSFKPQSQTGSDNKHDSVKLAQCIFTNYYSHDILSADTFVFDYDDTLVGRGNTFAEVSAFNKDALVSLSSSGKTVIVVTGNTIKAVNLHVDKSSSRANFEINYHDLNSNIRVYADGGLNVYNLDQFVKNDPANNTVPWSLIGTLDKSLLFSKDQITEIFNAVKKIGISQAKIENRHYATVSIKPIDKDYRHAIKLLLQMLLRDYNVTATGRTTIDISKFGADKSIAATDIAQAGTRDIVYVGDEIDEGNDVPFVNKAKQENIMRGIIKVNNPADTALFLRMVRTYSMVN